MTSRSSLCTVLFASLTLIPALTGCGNGFISTPVTTAAISITGNWQFASASSAAAKLPSFSGELSGTNTTFSGILHSNSSSACVAPSQSFAVTGKADASNNLTLTATGIAGGTLVLTGVLAQDGKSMVNTTYTVHGGSCAFAKPADATSQNYADISGTYKGSFTDKDGDEIAVSATLTQNAAADSNGNFSMSGSGTFGGGSNPCFASPTPVVSAQVTGSTFQTLYQDANSGAQINIQGTFSPDAQTLTLSGAQVSGPCGSATGSGTLTRQ